MHCKIAQLQGVNRLELKKDVAPTKKSNYRTLYRIFNNTSPVFKVVLIVLGIPKNEKFEVKLYLSKMHCKIAQLKRVNLLDTKMSLAMEETFTTPYLAERQ